MHDEHKAGFVYLKNKFPSISYATIKEAVLVVPQIRELIQGVKFEDQISEVEKAAWKSLKKSLKFFWEIKR
jgi:hypothetical protein